MNPAQRAHVLGSARQIVRLLREVRAAADSDSGRTAGTGVRPSNRIDRALLEATLTEAEAGLRPLLERSSESAPTQGADHVIAVILAFARVAVAEARPGRLRGYGSLAPAEAARIDAELDALTTAIERIGTAIHASDQGE